MALPKVRSTALWIFGRHETYHVYGLVPTSGMTRIICKNIMARSLGGSLTCAKLSLHENVLAVLSHPGANLDFLRGYER